MHIRFFDVTFLLYEYIFPITFFSNDYEKVYGNKCLYSIWKDWMKYSKIDWIVVPCIHIRVMPDIVIFSLILLSV